MKRLLKNLTLLFILGGSVAGAQNIWNCTSFNTSSSGACSVQLAFTSSPAFTIRGNGSYPQVTGTQVQLVGIGSLHAGYGMFYSSTVDVRAFTSTFTFVPDQWNAAFVVQNATYPSGYIGNNFTAGAGCEGGFYQAENVGSTNNTFGIQFSNSDSLAAPGGPSYSYSTVQIYQQHQIPCNQDNTSFPNYFSTTKLSTSPVNLGTSTTTSYTTTGDVYSVTVTYNGSDLSLCIYDVTAASGSCSSGTSGTGTFFTHTWSNVPIPAYLDSTTGYVGLMSGVGSGPAEPSAAPLFVNSFAYTVNSATGTPGTSAPSNGITAAANPTFSPAAGTYGAAQNVTLSDSTTTAYMCYTLSTSTCGGNITPIPDNIGGCGAGTKYTTAVNVPATNTLCARAGVDQTLGPTTMVMPSGLASAGYTITAGGTGTPVTLGGKAGLSGKAQAQ